MNGLTVSVDRISVKVRKTIEKWGASFNIECDGWVQGGIESTDINSHLYFGKGPVVAIRNSNVDFGDMHLDFHMNGICSVANGMITKSFVSTKLKDVAQSFLNSQLGKMEDAISNKINGIPKIKSILSVCGKVMDFVNDLTSDNNEEEEEEHASPAVQSTEESAASYQEEEHTSPAVQSTEESPQEEQRHSEEETKYFVDEMESRAAEPEDSAETTSTEGSLKTKSKADMDAAIRRKKSQKPSHEGAMKQWKRGLEAAFVK